jgi:clan AA aspartic protease (TIGR02281 family)
MKGVKTLCFTALIALTSSILHTQVAPKTVSLSDTTGIREASWTGDQDKLAYVASTMSGGPDVLAKALYQRSLYKLDESSATVAACGAIPELGKSAANSQCALILASNKLLANDVSGWAKVMDANKSIAYPKFAQMLHVQTSDLHIPEYEAVADFKPYFDFPAVGVTRDTDDFSMPLDWRSFKGDDHVGVFTVPVNINGKSIRMVLDTGASVVTFSKEDASLVGISNIHNGWLKVNEGARSEIGVAKELSIGHVRITNLPVLISPTPLKLSVIGLSALQYLGAIEIEGNMLHSSANGFGTACKAPMDMASWIDGSQNVFVVHGTVEGKNFRVALDSGDAWAISRNYYGTPPSNVTTRPLSMSVGGVAQNLYISDDQATMQIGDAPSANQSYVIRYKTQHSRFRYNIGADYVRQHRLVIDFKNSVLCLS